MEQIVMLLQSHWQYIVIFGGLLVLLGAICNWRWLTSPNGEKPFSLGRFVYALCGQNGYRIFMGVLGVVISACGIFLLLIG